jgi:hypothetical protein
LNCFSIFGIEKDHGLRTADDGSSEGNCHNLSPRDTRSACARVTDVEQAKAESLERSAS